MHGQKNIKLSKIYYVTNCYDTALQNDIREDDTIHVRMSDPRRKSRNKSERKKFGYTRFCAPVAVPLISSLVWMLRRVGGDLSTDVSGQHVGTIFKGQGVQGVGLVGLLK